MTLEEARALFPVLREVAYLNAGTFGPLAIPVAECLREQLERDLEHGRGGRAYIDAMLEARLRLRSRIAQLLSTEPESIAVTSSTTDSCNIVLAGLGLSPEDEVVTTDAEHFGLAGPIFTSGARVRVARVEGRPAAEAERLIAAEVTPRTQLVAVSHVLWTTGHVIDVDALRARIDVPLLVDGAQSVGAIPVAVGDVDYYTVSGQKWLCGPEATGALYVRDAERLRVARPSYFAQRSFEPGGEYVVREGAERFDPGWVPVGALRALVAAIDLAPTWRFDRIRDLAAHCRAALLEAGVEVVTEPRQAGLVTFRPEGDAAACVDRAWCRGVVVRDLPGKAWVRASCGWWNTEEDVERLVEAVAAPS
jgi:L-cysteine/cystine lyase